VSGLSGLSLSVSLAYTHTPSAFAYFSALALEFSLYLDLTGSYRIYIGLSWLGLGHACILEWNGWMVWESRDIARLRDAGVC
jgi:hypothetical protein